MAKDICGEQFLSQIQVSVFKNTKKEIPDIESIQYN